MSQELNTHSQILIYVMHNIIINVVVFTVRNCAWELKQGSEGVKASPGQRWQGEGGTG